ncbi:DUF1963 domain-containing protein, partial [Microcoleus sp.]|uniref:DUF1963 domain-containing protein n=1 Tax=Microcoleus sp. TaxID=44472 RepID=UPI00403E8BF8
LGYGNLSAFYYAINLARQLSQYLYSLQNWDAPWGNNPDSDTEQNILLFQMDSSVDDGVHILWGDDGICNFFISQS